MCQVTSSLFLISLGDMVTNATSLTLLVCLSLILFVRPVLKYFKSMVINQMEINGSAKYEIEDKET